VTSNEQVPGAGAMTAQMLTSPFVAVIIPRPPPASIVNFETVVKKAEQNRYLNKRNYRRRGRPG
jgi:hypothetical protein